MLPLGNLHLNIIHLLVASIHSSLKIILSSEQPNSQLAILFASNHHVLFPILRFLKRLLFPSFVAALVWLQSSCFVSYPSFNGFGWKTVAYSLSCACSCFPSFVQCLFFKNPSFNFFFLNGCLFPLLCLLLIPEGNPVSGLVALYSWKISPWRRRIWWSLNLSTYFDVQHTTLHAICTLCSSAWAVCISEHIWRWIVWSRRQLFGIYVNVSRKVQMAVLLFWDGRIVICLSYKWMSLSLFAD